MCPIKQYNIQDIGSNLKSLSVYPMKVFHGLKAVAIGSKIIILNCLRIYPEDAVLNIVPCLQPTAHCNCQLFPRFRNLDFKKLVKPFLIPR